MNTVSQVAFPVPSYYQPVGLSGAGVNDRGPLPGGQIHAGILRADVRNPGMRIEYSTNGVRWSTYDHPGRVGDYALLRTRGVDGRSSRIAAVDVPQWAAGVRYRRGALVLSEGELFRADRLHTSVADTPPQEAPLLWRLQQ